MRKLTHSIWLRWPIRAISDIGDDRALKRSFNDDAERLREPKVKAVGRSPVVAVAVVMIVVKTSLGMQ